MTNQKMTRINRFVIQTFANQIGRRKKTQPILYARTKRISQWR